MSVPCTWAADWDQTDHLLCVRLDQLGDVLMTTPAIRALKQARPGRRVTLLTSALGAAAAALVPDVDNVVVYDPPWMKSTADRASSGPEYAMAEELRRRSFDGAVIFTVYSQSPLPAAFLCYLADVPLRLAHCRENPYQILSHWLPDPEPGTLVRHEVRRQLDLVAAIGCRTDDERLSVRVAGSVREAVARRLAALGIDVERPWVAIHPGATAPSRRYAPEGFAAVARSLAAEDRLPIVFVGTEAERELVAAIRAAIGAPSHSLVGSLDLAELAALLSLATILIANNSGPVHLAAAVGTPVVDLYALTNPQHTPWGVAHRVLSHDVPCKYCYKSVCPEGHHNCLRLITPEEVVRAARELLSEVAAHPVRRTHHRSIGPTLGTVT